MPRDGGAAGEDRECSGALPGARFVVGGTCGAVDDYSRRGPDYGADLGAGSGRRAAVFLDQESHQLLRVVWGREEFGNTVQRTPLSKQRNKHLQTTLIEAAKMAPRNSPELAMLYDKEKQKGNANRATLAVARKLVAYLMAVDRGQRNFQVAETSRHRCVARGDEQGGFLRRVACQVLPLTRLGEGAQALDAPVDKFPDWQENTNSIFCEDHSLV